MRSFTRDSKPRKLPRKKRAIFLRWAHFAGRSLIDRTLQMTISGEVRTQNAPYVMRGILLNKDAREKAWSFMKATLGGNAPPLPRQLNSPYVRRYHRASHSRA